MFVSIKDKALNIYLNPNNTIDDVYDYLDQMVAEGRITQHERRCILHAVFTYDD